MPLTTLLIDDEPDARALLRMMLHGMNEVHIAGEAGDVNSALEMIEEKLPDLLFLDIEMPGGGGFELVRKMQALDLKPDIIFVTAFSQYAIEAIRASAFDYILKPIDEAQLRKAVNRLRCQRKQMGGRGIGQLVEELRKPARLRVNVRSGFLMLEPAEILYLEADGSYTDIYMCNGRHELTSTNLSQILDQLPARDFLRISRSLCINLAYLTRIDRNKHCCILQEGEKKYELHVSRRYFSRIDEATQ
ncbi:MAG TPA: LytTR family DNA-binding domain-containing protein, partial [Bacteroidales bacterium]|nr:LytTR family DNA-binding domain-containing protein [Bacteroidales bacterium]